MAKGRVYCRNKVGREVPWGRGRAWVDFSLKDPSGKSHRVRRPVDVLTKSEAEIELARLMTEKAAELKVATPAATFSALQLGPCFDAWVKSRSHHPKIYSARAAEARVRVFILFVGRGRPLPDVLPDDVAQFRDERLFRLGMKPQTVKVDLASISSFFTWCMGKPRTWLTSNPVRGVDRPAVKRTQPSAIRDWDEVEKIIEAVRGDPILEPAYRLAFATVCREEIAMARWEHVDLKRGTIRIPEGKNSAREVEIPLHPIAIDWLRENAREAGYIIEGIVRCEGHKRPWGQRLEYRRNRKNAERKKAGLLPLPGFHKGRHTIATAMVRNGASLPVTQVMLRHSSPTTTAKYYTGVRAMDAGEHLRRVGQKETEVDQDG